MKKWFKLSVPVLLIAGLMIVTACAPLARESPQMPPSESAFKGEGYVPDGDVPGEVTTERKIVRTGFMTLEVEDIAWTMEEIVAVADELGGYVVSSRKHEDEKTSGSIRIRVPSDRFEAAFERLRQLAIAVPYENTEARDVTEEYVDLEARLRNLEATEAQYLALLEKAETVEEMLKVQREISNIRGQIEQIEGRMKYLERTSDMALIDITLQESKPLAGSWSPTNAIRSAVHGLVTFGRGLLTVLIWLGIFCWVWIPPLVIWLRRRKKKA